MVIDMREVTFLASAGLQVLLRSSHMLAARRMRMRVIASSAVRRITDAAAIPPSVLLFQSEPADTGPDWSAELRGRPRRPQSQ